MSKIAFLPNILNNGNVTGIGRYSINLIKELVQQNNYSNYITIDVPENYNIFNIPNIDIGLSASDILLSDKILSLKAYLLNIKLIHSFYAELPEKKTYKSVLTIHDLICIKHPEWFINNRSYDYMNIYLRRTANNVDHIIAVSNQTKNDIIELFNIPQEKISVIYLGVDEVFNREYSYEEDTLKKYNIDKEYILSVCTFEPRKNITRILDTYEKFRENNKEDIKLVLTGGKGWKYTDIFNKINLNKYNKDIIITGYVSNEELAILYKNSLVFVYPSLYEGFGLPVLEAMACGTAVITSNTTSLPEVGGDAVCYCEPESVDSILNCLEKVIFLENYRKELKFKSLKRNKKFSYKETAKKTSEIYNMLLNS